MLFTQAHQHEQPQLGEKNNFISSLNHRDQEKRLLALENERLAHEVSTLRRNEIDLRLAKEQ